MKQSSTKTTQKSQQNFQTPNNDIFLEIKKIILFITATQRNTMKNKQSKGEKNMYTKNYKTLTKKF